VRFTADLSEATFHSTAQFDQITQQSYSNGYRPDLHNLIFLWDLGDDAQWSAPQNVLPGWKNKRFARGPVVQHVYAEPGLYTVKLTVIEPLQGLQQNDFRVAFAEDLLVEVRPQGDAFPNTNTICVNPVGDNDFSLAPSGSLAVQADHFDHNLAIWQSRLGGAPKRWLFKRGATYSLGLQVRETSTPGTAFGAYGDEGLDRPILNVGTGGVGFHFINYALNDKGDTRISDLDLRGGFDPSSNAVNASSPANGASAIRWGRQMDFTMSNLSMTGFELSTISAYWNQSPGDNWRFAMDDCEITDFGGQYATIHGYCNNVETSMSFTGTAIVQNPNASADDTELRAPIRVNDAGYFHARGCDIFHTSEAGQPGFKLGESGAIKHPVINVHSNTVESCYACISVNQGMGEGGNNDGGNINNAVIDGNILIGGHVMRTFVGVTGQGVTIRNNLGWQPGIAASDGIGLRDGAVWASRAGDNVTTEVAPIRSHHNTWVMDRDTAQNADAGFSELNNTPKFTNNLPGNPGFGDVTSIDNFVHAPALDTPNVDSVAPDIVSIGFEPRSVGRTAVSTFSLDGAFDPPGPVPHVTPASGGGAFEQSEGPFLAHHDIEGALRPGSRTKGAFDPNAI
jgi:hypothetical protein